MSTIPSTSSIPYTVVGESGTGAPAAGSGISLVVLNRGGRPLRTESLLPFANAGNDELIIVLGPHPHYEIEQLAASLPRTRFVLLQNDVTVGEQLNVGIREARSSHVMTMWSDMYAPQLTPRVVERMDELGVLCGVPLLRNERNEVIPSIIAPAFFKSLFRTIPVTAGSEGALSLYVYADTGVFNKDRFEQLGGYDARVANVYWQRLDFGFRAYLWGEKIGVLPSLRVQASRSLPVDDTTPDRSYARFHLKNLSVRFVRDQGKLPLRQLVPFVLRSGLGVSESVRQFREARRWVQRNRYRFTQDARRVTELWEVDG